MTKFNSKGRNITGILLLDKPINITSNQALQCVKRFYNARKAGHTGSLDPLANGMLPICFGEATKFSQFLLEADKGYLVTGKLGVVTASGDADSPILATRPVGKLSTNLMEETLKAFRGKIAQLPSMYSAIKQNGQPLYKLARQGVVVDRASRDVMIYNLKLLDLQDDLIKLEVFCSKGTYIRTLVADIGEKLGCGAYVTELRRLSVGHYQAEEMIAFAKLKELAGGGDGDGDGEQQADSGQGTSVNAPSSSKFASLDALLLPVESILTNTNELQITDEMVYYLRLGQAVLIPKTPRSGYVKLKNKRNQFIGVGEVTEDGKVAPKRILG
jgi:tRNA pseudouridine55 synthase